MLYLRSLIFVFILTIVSYGQMGIPFDMDVIQLQEQNRSGKYKTDEEKLEFIQSQYLKEMFLKYIFNSDLSLLTEEDKAETLVPVSDLKMQNDLMIQMYADLLAKQDLLQLKKLYLGKSSSPELRQSFQELMQAEIPQEPLGGF